MKTNEMLEQADGLVAAAEDVAAMLSEGQEEFGIDFTAEASLRASIAAVTFALNAYLELNAAADRSPVARSFVEEAKTRCEKSMKQLRRRVVRCTATLRRHTAGRLTTTRVEEFVRATST